MISEERQEENASKNRKCTDIYVPIVWLVLLFSVIIYCLIFSDLRILTKGRDDCGNICGELNNGIVGDQCGLHDMTNHQKLLIQRHENKSWIIEYKCIEEFPQNLTSNIIQCWQKGDSIKRPNFLTDYGKKVHAFTRYLTSFWTGIGIYCLFTLIFSCVILILLRFIPQVTVWVVPILLTAVLFLVSVLSVLASFDAPSNGIASNLFLFVGAFVILMCVFARKVMLVGKVFGVMAKSIMNFPWIILVTIVTFLILTIVISAFLFTSLLIETSGTFSSVTNEDGQLQLQYEGTKVMKIAQFLNILTFLWLANFIVNCQHFIVAGSVTKWYFTHDKSGMAGINKSSVFNLVRFHLGSVCFGSIAVPVMRVIHFGFRVVKCIKVIFTSCFQGLQCQVFDSIDRALGTYSRSAYILIESHGTPFSDSGRKSYDLLLKNLGDAYWLNFFRDASLFLNQIFVPFVGIFAGILIKDFKADEHTGISPVVVDFTFTILIAHCFFMAYGMTIDTILLCFCIDLKENDGETKPYFMSDELKKVAMKIRKSCGLEVEFGHHEGARDNVTLMS